MSSEFLRIGDLDFAVESASISGAIWQSPGGDQRWHIPWFLNVYGVGREVEIVDDDDEDDEPWSPVWHPRAYSEEMPISIRSWRDFAGLTIEEAGPAEYEPLDLRGFNLCVFQHTNTRSNRLRFGHLDGTNFSLSWEALCAPYCGEDCWEGVPLSIRTRATFTDVRVARSKLDAAVEAVGDRFCFDDFAVSEESEADDDSPDGERDLLLVPRQ